MLPVSLALMVPTRRFWLLIALGIPVAALSGAAGSLWPVVAYNVLVFGVAYATGLMAPDGKSLRVTRKYDPVLSVRVGNRIEVKVLNDGVETVSAQFRDEPPPLFEASRKEFDLHLKPGQETALSYSVTPYERGGDFFRGTYLRVRAPLGLVLREVKLRTEQPLRVYPNVLALREFDLLKQRGRLNQVGIRRSRTRGLGMEFESLREYTEGDDYRKIDWKASARSSKIVVRQYDIEKNQSIIVCVDVGRRMLSEIEGVTKLDHTLDAVLMLTHAASVAGDCVGLLVYADTVRRYIPPRKGRNQVGIIIEALHDLVAEPVESDPAGAFAYLASRWKRRSLVVAFGDATDAEEAKQFCVAFGPIARHHIALLASVSDPGLKQAAEQGIEIIDDLYVKAASLLFYTDRKLAASVLTSAGIHNLDAEPQDLSAALVSYYFMVKERSLL
jgi:uncharacterized protein (DUF58 family)